MAKPLFPAAVGFGILWSMTDPNKRPATETNPGRRVRLLFADDSLVSRRSIVDFLQSRPRVDLFAVCENGRAAVEHALRDQPDVVLLDLQMPVMSGTEAAKIFRSCMPRTGIILTSLHDQPDVQAACLAAGADVFISKAKFAREFDAALERALIAAKAVERDLLKQPPSGMLGGNIAPPAPSCYFPVGAVTENQISVRGTALPRGETPPPSRRDP